MDMREEVIIKLLKSVYHQDVLLGVEYARAEYGEKAFKFINKEGNNPIYRRLSTNWYRFKEFEVYIGNNLIIYVER